MKVLVVEDNEMLRGHLVDLLCESPGVSLVATARDLAGALATGARIEPDLTLARFMLPDGNAIDFLRAMRDWAPGSDTVILDDHAVDAHAAQCTAEGACAYLTHAALSPLLARYTTPHDVGGAGPLLHPVDEVERIAALNALDILDSPRDDVLDNLVRMAASACQAPIAMLSVVDADRAWIKASTGVKVTELPRNLTLCQYVVASAAALTVRDIAGDPRFRGNPLTRATPAFAAYAGVPLRAKDGHAIGALCAIDSVPRTFDDAQVEALERMADLAMARFDGRAQLRALAREAAELEQRVRVHERAERLHRSLVDSIDGLVWECDAATLACLVVSDGLARLFDLQPGSWLERPDAWRDMVCAADRARVQQAFDAARVSSSAQPLDFAMEGSDGRRVFLRGHVQAIEDAHGRRRLRAVALDVTETKESAAYIADLLERYQRALRSGTAHD